MKKEKRKDGKAKEAPKVMEEWLYLAEEEGALRRLYECLREEEGQKAEFWEEAGVLEIGLLDAGSVDLEILPEEEWDADLRAFAGERRTALICTAVFRQEDGKKARKVMEMLVQKAGGIFCRDNEEFLPRISGETGG